MDDGPALSPDLQAVVEGRSLDPFAVLGRHRTPDGEVIRVMLPGAFSVSATARDEPAVQTTLHPVRQTGLFIGPSPGAGPYLLRIDWGGPIQETEDTYAFGPLLGELDIYLLAEGKHRELADCLGAHAVTIDGVKGVRFAVWAPNARRVSVVGDFNTWDGRRHPMRLRHGAGVWEIFVPRLAPGALYKYELLGPDGSLLPQRADPVAWRAEPPPATGSIVDDPAPFRWSDDPWLAARAKRQAPDAPMSIYEVHAGSWLRDGDGRSLGWSELADKLVDYVARMGFTHVEFLPVMLHPFGGSWGYQPLGQFAPNAVLGTPEEFALLIDRCHNAGIGVLLDWVPAHFPTDAHGLARFDGTPLYEHADPREGYQRDWNTFIYNLGRNEVRGFLIGSALHWLRRFHADGLRVDAVAAMLYRDYSRQEGEWVPNMYGGRENLEAVGFLQELRRAVDANCPGAILVAEESTAWPGVTRSPDDGGLGFHYKWNMGWMHDTLDYIGHEPVHRRYHHHSMTFGMIYAYSERFILPLSHDEVVYGKHSIFGRMPGDRWQRFANLRAYLGFMWTHPGKKLLFMGGEFGQEGEWNHDAQPEWHLLDDPQHRGVQRLVRDLNRLYAGEPALFEQDYDPAGFRWVISDDREQSVYAYLRMPAGNGPPLLSISNFTPVPRDGYRLGVPEAGRWRALLNTDASRYGGSDYTNGHDAMAEAASWHEQPASLTLNLPPLATVILRLDGP
ncbi:MAG: 1,4-alpha-glucan branching protein GlgB [Alphaproteobacteria bacterium]|nr:1,4-alpha-glucan branching protein GlgB [Alphaproteobacteria bacterium]